MTGMFPITGINCVMYYAPTIFAQAPGVRDGPALDQWRRSSVWWWLACTLSSMSWWIELGRRPIVPVRFGGYGPVD